MEPIVPQNSQKKVFDIQDSQSSPYKVRNQIKKAQIKKESSLRKSQKVLKAAFCGCLQNSKTIDEERESDDDIQIETKKNVKLNSKKLGSYMQLWIDKTQHSRHDIEIIFDLLNNQLQEFEATIIKGDQKKHYIITDDLKVVYYDVQKKVMVKEDLVKSHHIQNKFESIFFKNQILTCIAASPDCKQYYLGFQNGSVHIVDAVKFESQNSQLTFEKNWEDNPVVQIFFYQKQLFVSHKNGLVNIFKKKLPVQNDDKNGPNLLNTAKQYIFKCSIKNETTLDQLEFSETGKCLLGIQNTIPKLKIQSKEIEQNFQSSDSDISNIIQEDNDQLYKKQAVIYQIPFYQPKSRPIYRKFGEINFEIKRLFIVSQQKVILISDTMDGIQIFSLNDFEIEGHLKKMHESQILDFLLLDQNTLITTGKDKRVKIWDLQNQTLLKQLPIQKQMYSTLGISRDQKYMVTGGKDQVVFWYISNWQKLCTLIQPQVDNFYTSSLNFSQSDILLYAKDNYSKDIIFWHISDTSLSLEFGNHQITRVLMTFDNKYLITENKQGTTVLWRLETRSLLKVLVLKSGFKQEFNCTSDSKYIFFKIDDAQLVKFNLITMKKEKVFYCNGEITFTCIDSDNTMIFISNANKILQIFGLNSKKQEQLQINQNQYKLLNKNKKKSIFDIKYQKDNDFIQEMVFRLKQDKVNDVEEKEYFPTFALSNDNNIIVITVDGEQTLILNISDPKNPKILFRNKDQQQQNNDFFNFENFYKNYSDSQEKHQFKNIKSFTIDHSGDQIILVDGKKAVVLQLVDHLNNNEKALVKDLISFQNESESLNITDRQRIDLKMELNNRYRYIQTQVLFKLSQEDNFYAYYVEKESLVLTKLNQTWSLWCTQKYDDWNKILEFEGDYKVVRGKNRILIGLIDEDNQIKFISRKLLTDLSGKNEDFIYKSIQKFEIIKFLKDHLHRSTATIREQLQDYDWKKYEEYYLKIVGQNSNLEKHNVLNLGKVKTQQLIIADKRIQEKLDYDEQRRIINKLYPNTYKNRNNFTHRSYMKQSMKITGPVNYLYPYILTEMIKDQSNIINYIEALKKNNINPFNINILHYFTYQNQIHCMNACLDQGIKYNRDRFDNTPLAYALKRKSMKSIENILKHAVDHNHQEIISSITQKEICQLIEQSPQKLVAFLENTYMEIQEEIPVFGMIKSSGLVGSNISFFLENRVLMDKKDAEQYYVNSQSLSKQGMPIEMKSLQFQYNFTIGSNQSLEFHWALENSKRKVYQCTPVQKIIQYKWQNLKYFAQFQFFVTLAYCIILILHLYNLEQTKYIILLCIFCIYFLMFQIVSLLSGELSKMLKDIWTFSDLTFLLLLIFYLILEIGLIGIIDHQKYLLAFLNFVSWLRCISQLRGFKSTRMFIKQVVLIIFDLKSFMIVLIGAIMAVASTFNMLTNNPSQISDQDQTDFENYLYVVWEYVFQQFPGSYIPQYSMPVQTPVNSSMTLPVLFPLEYDIQYQLVLHFFAQIFISLIMMNLVIAIINDTLQKSMANNQQEDFKELNNMILFYEKFLFWRKNQGVPQYLHWLEYGNNMDEDQKINEEESQLEQSFNQMNEKIDKIIEENSKDKIRIESTEKYIIKLTQMIDEVLIQKKKTARNDSLEKDYNDLM